MLVLWICGVLESLLIFCKYIYWILHKWSPLKNSHLSSDFQKMLFCFIFNLCTTATIYNSQLCVLPRVFVLWRLRYMLATWWEILPSSMFRSEGLDLQDIHGHNMRTCMYFQICMPIKMAKIACMFIQYDQGSSWAFFGSKFYQA